MIDCFCSLIHLHYSHYYMFLLNSDMVLTSVCMSSSLPIELEIIHVERHFGTSLFNAIIILLLQIISFSSSFSNYVW